MSSDKWRLKPEQLSHRCAPERFTFKTTAELSPQLEIIGQPRGTRAIEFGIDMKSAGYNIYVVGPRGTGRLTAVRRFIEARAQSEPTPDDWLYVHSFDTPHRPRALRLPAGQGYELSADMSAFVAYLREQIPQAFESEVYHDAAQAIRKNLESKRDAILQALQVQAAARSLAVVRSAAGVAVVPLRPDGQLMEAEAYQQLPPERRAEVDEAIAALEDAVQDRLREIRALEREAQKALSDLAGQVAAHTIDHYMTSLKARWAEFPDVVAHLDAMRADVIQNVNELRAEKTPTPPAGASSDPFQRYQVNLIVDNRKAQGAPVVVIDQPSVRELVGRVEHKAAFGALVTDFTMIKAGALHRANGGYLVVRALDVFDQPYAWQALKRALTTREIRIENPEALTASAMTTQTLEPEPIPLDMKVILLGSPWIYEFLNQEEEDFSELFKVKSDFDRAMQRTAESEETYAHFIATRCHEEGLLHFDPNGVARLVDYGSRLAGDQHKLSTRFGTLADLIREAAYWARQSGAQSVTDEHVERAIDERRYRHSLEEEHFREQITDGTILVDTGGAVVGQANSLVIAESSDYSYGLPSRITAQVHLGREGVVQIDREVNLAGPIHNKGVLILRSYLGAMYAQERQLSLNASLTFEQHYVPLDGDSASSTELYALLSALSRIPIQQGIAATGSVNQLGQVQAIGGVNEKIEGFYALCKARGLTGEQGVIIPAANVRHLMLSDEVVQAVAEGRFHLWAVETIDQGIEVLTGVPAGALDADGNYPPGTVNRAVLDRLIELDEKMEKDSKDDPDPEDDAEHEQESSENKKR